MTFPRRVQVTISDEELVMLKAYTEKLGLNPESEVDRNVAATRLIRQYLKENQS